MKLVAGVDEVGRGSLVGPVFAAAVILNNSINKRLLKDSKKLSKNKRESLAKYIMKNSTIGNNPWRQQIGSYSFVLYYQRSFRVWKLPTFPPIGFF